MTLDGLQTMLAEKFRDRSKSKNANAPLVNLVRYADDCAPRATPRLGVDAMMMMEEGPPISVCRN